MVSYKKDRNKYRLINAAININRVTIKDTNLPPYVNKFSKEFIGYRIISLIDFFFNYN
jgi:hypothetical protein